MASDVRKRVWERVRFEHSHRFEPRHSPQFDQAKHKSVTLIHTPYAHLGANIGVMDETTTQADASAERRKMTTGEAEAVLTLVGGGWLRLELNL